MVKTYMPSSTPTYVALPNRGQIRVSGSDAPKFLQGLISNDLDKLSHQPSLHACLLTAQGKFLYDFIMTLDGPDYLLDCEGSDRTKDLLRRLTMYKLRAQVTLTAHEKVDVYAVLNESFGGTPDPRDSQLGLRTSVRPNLPESPFTVWDDLRIRLGIADGSRDAELEKSTLEELNMTRSAVSFEKGCYVGQELTARMEHRGLGKRHLVPLGFNTPLPAAGEEIILAGRIIGSMRSSCGSIGLALIRDDTIELLRETNDQSPLYLLGQ